MILPDIIRCSRAASCTAPFSGASWKVVLPGGFWQCEPQWFTPNSEGTWPQEQIGAVLWALSVTVEEAELVRLVLALAGAPESRR